MVMIKKDNFREGRAIGKSPEEQDSLYEAFADIADDLQGLNGLVTTTITSASAVAAAINPPTKAEFDVVVTLVNEIKTKLNLTNAVSITSPSATEAAGDPPTKIEFDKVVTLVNEIKTKLNAAIAGTTLKTVKA